jgi:K+-transporting ATPase ATPase B chain
MKRDTVAKLLQQPHFGSAWIPMRASELRKGVVICGGRRHDCA